MLKIKVLQVIGTLHIGGAENVAMNLYRFIDRDKFEFHYLVYGNKIGEYEKEVEQLGGKVIHMDPPSKNRLIFQRELEKVMKKHGPYDVVHAHMLFHNGIVLKTAYKVKVPCRIAHSHSTQNIPVNNNVISFIQAIYQKNARKKIIKYATNYLACGEKAGKFLFGEELFKKNGKVINNGISAEKFRFNLSMRKKMRSKLQLEEKYVYSNIAHFYPVKNHTFLIDIFKEILSKQEEAILLLIGEGYLKEKIIQKVEQLGISEHVIFMGNINNVSEMLQAIDMILMPSLFEGLPVSLVEAQAAGVRCTISNRITKETDCTGLLQFIPLEQTACEWANHIFEFSKYERTSTLEQIKKANYDVKNNVSEVEKIYDSRK